MILLEDLPQAIIQSFYKAANIGEYPLISTLSPNNLINWGDLQKYKGFYLYAYTNFYIRY